jgi:hypothetical protein
MIQKLRETLPIQEAMDNLTAIANINLSAPGPIGIVKKTRIITDDEGFAEKRELEKIEWLSGEGCEAILEILDQTYHAVHHHLIRLLEMGEMEWKSERSTRAIVALMALVGESVERIQKYLEFRIGKPIDEITERESYRSLQEFYQNQFLQIIKDKESHQEPEGIVDMDAVRSDREYELFYIRHEDGTPYFKLDLLRHMRLIADFESEGKSFEEDPLLRVRSMLDRDTQVSARQILTYCQGNLEDFYKIFQKNCTNDLVSTLSSASTALFLAANPQNLLQHTTGKTSLSYFENFHTFLRAAFHTSEYQKMVAYPPDASDKVAYILLHLTHALSSQLFHRAGGVKQEAIGLIHRTARKGTEREKAVWHEKGETIWNQFLIDDENYRTLLAQFPSGPLLKILDLLQSEEGEIVAFDPVMQGNVPMKQFTMNIGEKKIDFLRIPSPTRQTLINKVEIIEEFRGFLRFYHSQKKGGKHLLINLQDKTSWKEFSRTKTLEGIQKNAEFSSVLSVFTLPKTTDFYFQSGEYLNLNVANDFFTVFLKQLETPEECGYCLPSSFKSTEIYHFAEKIVPIIHIYFFDKSPNLKREERENFIEIFNQFLILKLLDHIRPTSISFTCKDAVDTGAAQTASFYAFLKILGDQFKTQEEHDFFRWLLYCPALFIRERAIDPERFTRMLSGLEQLAKGWMTHSKAIKKEITGLYRSDFFQTLEV